MFWVCFFVFVLFCFCDAGFVSMLSFRGIEDYLEVRTCIGYQQLGFIYIYIYIYIYILELLT